MQQQIQLRNQIEFLGGFSCVMLECIHVKNPLGISGELVKMYMCVSGGMSQFSIPEHTILDNRQYLGGSNFLQVLMIRF